MLLRPLVAGRSHNARSERHLRDSRARLMLLKEDVEFYQAHDGSRSLLDPVPPGGPKRVIGIVAALPRATRRVARSKKDAGCASFFPRREWQLAVCNGSDAA